MTFLLEETGPVCSLCIETVITVHLSPQAGPHIPAISGDPLPRLKLHDGMFYS